MEFFVCPCPATGVVVLDNVDQGPNKDDQGNPAVKMCNEGVHTVSLRCGNGKSCHPFSTQVYIGGTNPASPQKVPFTCE